METYMGVKRKTEEKSAMCDCSGKSLLFHPLPFKGAVLQELHMCKNKPTAISTLIYDFRVQQRSTRKLKPKNMALAEQT